MAHLIKVRGSLLEPPAERKILRVKAPKAHWQLPVDFLTYRTPNPEAKYIRLDSLPEKQGKTRNKKLYTKETDDTRRDLVNNIQTLPVGA